LSEELQRARARIERLTKENKELQQQKASLKRRNESLTLELQEVDFKKDNLMQENAILRYIH
jgi:FtsZ-binding cell division protein ZapB